MENKLTLLEEILKHNHYKIERSLKEATIRGLNNLTKVYIEYVDSVDPSTWTEGTERPKEPYSPKDIAELMSFIPGWELPSPLIMINYGYVKRLINGIILMESKYADPEVSSILLDEDFDEKGIERLLIYGKYFAGGYTIDELSEKIRDLAIFIMSSATGLKIQNMRAISVTSGSSRILIDAIMIGEKKKIKTKVLFDTGAEETLVQREVALEIGAKPTGYTRRVRGISGAVEECQEARMCLKLLQDDGQESYGCWNVSLHNNVKDITGGFPILLGMDYAYECGKKIKVVIE